MRYTNELTNEITNEISGKQCEYRNLNTEVQKSNNLSEVPDYDDVQTKNAMLRLAENSSTRNEFANI